jgi:hypothetical protein
LSFEGTFLEEHAAAAPFFRTARTIAENIMGVGYAPDLDGSIPPIPPGEDQLVFSILMEVSPTAEPGSTLQLVPYEGDGVGPARMRSEISYLGGAKFISVLPQAQPGRLQIVGDLAIFRRGDTNVDQHVDISDPIATLGFLFLGGTALPCADAADANDDGKVDISDAIATLTSLFLGGLELPPPNGSSGEDPTSDGLGCQHGA